MEFLIAGSETTATLLACTVQCLAMNPEAEARLKQEIATCQAAKAAKPNEEGEEDVLQYADLEKYTYVEQVCTP